MPVLAPPHCARCGSGDRERRQLERNLHDGAQQRLVTLSLQLRLLANRLPANADAQLLLADARSELAASLSELRELARGLHPAVLSDHGLAAALESLAVRAPLPVTLTLDIEPGLAPEIEVAAYYVVSEALTNVAKYAQARTATISVVSESGRLLVRVSDNGVGGADPARGSGLRGLADRVEALGGRLLVSSLPSAGTTVRAEIPA